MLTEVTNSVKIKVTLDPKETLGFELSFDYSEATQLNDFFNEAGRFVSPAKGILVSIPIWEAWLEKEGIKYTLKFFGSKLSPTYYAMKIDAWVNRSLYQRIGDYKYKITQEVTAQHDRF